MSRFGFIDSKQPFSIKPMFIDVTFWRLSSAFLTQQQWLWQRYTVLQLYYSYYWLKNNVGRLDNIVYCFIAQFGTAQPTPVQFNMRHNIIWRDYFCRASGCVCHGPSGVSVSYCENHSVKTATKCWENQWCDERTGKIPEKIPNSKRSKRVKVINY